mgnify:CR=1 FL=1
MTTLDNLHPLSNLTDQFPNQITNLEKASRETLETSLKLLLTALKWFVGRQERGRVLSVFSTFIFKVTIKTVENMIDATIAFDFDKLDTFYVQMFEENHPGISIDQRFDKTVKQ